MSISLKNLLLELEIQEPGKRYSGSRFDWTGQISQIIYKEKHTFCTNETTNHSLTNELGRGLYNEFGIDLPFGYDDCAVNSEFPKIGIGFLRKDDNSDYNFFRPYSIFPAIFSTVQNKNAVVFNCKTKTYNGYGYNLIKEIVLKGHEFSINYKLFNSGTKPIITNEYIHNFLAINYRLIDKSYSLYFSAQLQTNGEVVNPEEKIQFNHQTINFESAINKEFFFSNIIPPATNDISWKLQNHIDKIGISESCNFSPQKVNLWGQSHVVSPEIFFKINLEPGESIEWQRNYEVFEF